MASILDRYGIKEVADVTFYNIDKTSGKPDKPVLYLDTLKVSTIEQTAETSDARGGKGNPKLITWDYGKDITVTLEDALFSAKSLSIMFGNGTVSATTENVQKTVMARVAEDGKIEYFMADTLINGSSVRKKVYFTTPKNGLGDGILFNAANPTIHIKKVTSEEGYVLKLTTETSTSNYTGEVEVDSTVTQTTPDGYTIEKGDKVFITYEISANTKTISVSADTFPGTYYVTGDTYARSDVDGSDQFFQFVIPKAKVTSENTITLEAEGDPSVFNMNLSVLRPEDGEMMKLIQYDLAANTEDNGDEEE